MIYQKKRSFRIPFHIDAEGRARLKEIQLWVSEDSGFHWEPKSKTTPDLGRFTFRTTHDGEFWFATRTLTVEDKYSPPMDQTVEPSMKVVVDTVPPSIVLESDGRRGVWQACAGRSRTNTLISRRCSWNIRLMVPANGGRCRSAACRLLGAHRWDAGTADSLRVRASVADKAGNVADAEIVMPEGTAGDTDFAAADADTSAPPVEQISKSGSAIVAGPEFPPVQEIPDQGGGSTVRSSTRRTLARRTGGAQSPAIAPSPPPVPDWHRDGAAGMGNARAPVVPGSGLMASAPAFSNPFPMTNTAGAAALPGAADAFSSTGPVQMPRRAGSQPVAIAPCWLPGPRFKLQYAIEDAGPDGPAVVELWMTQDGGRTWIRRGEDPDRVSPFDVDLGGEGTYGLSLVARSASGLGDQPPAPAIRRRPGSRLIPRLPRFSSTRLRSALVPHAGKVAITWRASDLHLAPLGLAVLASRPAGISLAADHRWAG